MNGRSTACLYWRTRWKRLGVTTKKSFRIVGRKRFTSEAAGCWTSCSQRSNAVTEQEWIAGAGPATMLRFLRSKASGRKLRLFACACVRRVWHLLDRDEQARAVVEAVEQYADE